MLMWCSANILASFLSSWEILQTLQQLEVSKIPQSVQPCYAVNKSLCISICKGLIKRWYYLAYIAKNYFKHRSTCTTLCAALSHSSCSSLLRLTIKKHLGIQCEAQILHPFYVCNNFVKPHCNFFCKNEMGAIFLASMSDDRNHVRV